MIVLATICYLKRKKTNGKYENNTSLTGNITKRTEIIKKKEILC